MARTSTVSGRAFSAAWIVGEASGARMLDARRVAGIRTGARSAARRASLRRVSSVTASTRVRHPGPGLNRLLYLALIPDRLHAITATPLAARVTRYLSPQSKAPRARRLRRHTRDGPTNADLEREVDREVRRRLGRRERAEVIAPPHPVPAQL